MYRKYTLPLSIFVVFENINAIIWTSEKFYNNSYVIYINQSWLYSINIFLKNDLLLNNSTLLENSAIDNKNNKLLLGGHKTHLNSKILLFYVYLFYTLKAKIIILTSYNCFCKLSSIDKIYKSSSWLERETGEMFNINFLFKTDNRRLLLDYSRQENPLLKDYPVEGFNDVFYNFFEDQVVWNNSTVVEL